MGFNRPHAGSGPCKATSLLTVNCSCILGSPCSQRWQTVEVMAPPAVYYLLHVGQEGIIVLLKEINCWGGFPKCFLLCSYLSEYLFQLLLTCQWVFFFCFLPHIFAFVCMWKFMMGCSWALSDDLTYWFISFPFSSAIKTADERSYFHHSFHVGCSLVFSFIFSRHHTLRISVSSISSFKQPYSIEHFLTINYGI